MAATVTLFTIFVNCDMSVFADSLRVGFSCFGLLNYRCHMNADKYITIPITLSELQVCF